MLTDPYRKPYKSIEEMTFEELNGRTILGNRKGHEFNTVQPIERSQNCLSCDINVCARTILHGSGGIV